MVIAILSDEIFPFSLGGIQKHTSNLAKYFAQNKINVLIFTSLPEMNLQSKLNTFFSNEELRYIAFHDVPKPANFFFPGHYLLEAYIHSKFIFREILKFGINKIDFIYAQGFSGWYLLKHKSKYQTKIGLNFHGLEMFQQSFGIKSKLQQLLFRPFVQKNIKRTDIYFSLGAKITHICNKISPSTLTFEIPVAVNDSWCDLQREDIIQNFKKFVFIGRYERRKGLEELILALNKLSHRYTEFKIEFIGDFPKSITSIINPNIHTIFHGPIYDENKIQTVFLKSDVLICPSYSEGMPTVIIEAMACSNAILATNVGAVSELVDQKNGWLIDPGNVNQLAEYIHNILDMNASELTLLKRNSKIKFMDNFRWSIVINKLITVIQKNI